MYVLKGFIASQALTDNAVGMVSPIGELSTFSRTFSKEIGRYAKPSHPDVTMWSFVSKMDDVKVPVPNEVVDIIIPIMGWISQESIAGRLNGNRAAFIADFLSSFSNQIDELEVGDMKSTANNLSFMPEFMLFKLKNITAYDTYIKLWMSDDTFRRQYDEYHITVVPPVDNLNDLFRSPGEVDTMIRGMDDTQKMMRIQTARDGHPDTLTRTDMYNWSNPIDPDFIVPTPWTVIIYGPAGNNVDLIREALTTYALENSDYDREQWSEFIPDLFKRTEYVIIPMWDNFSIPNETMMQGLFSPTVHYSKMLSTAMKFLDDYPEEHVREHLTSSVSMYRSLSYLAIGGPENRDEIYDYQSRFPDIVTLPTTSSEFGRMSEKTQQWLIILAGMFRIAETITQFSDIPMDMTRLERDGKLYLVRTFDGVQYLVVSQSTYLNEMMPVHDDDDLDY